MNNQIAIKTQNLTKTFGSSIAVHGLNLEVKKGELFGLVGPDGAGKTTIMRLLTAIMMPTSGDAWIGGHSILSEGETIKEKLGYMAQRFGLYEDLTVIENIHFYADLYGVLKKERPERIERLLNFSNLTPFTQRLAGNLSGGMKQKLGLACALVHTPEVLFLDEPTCGVDPVSRRDFWRILYDLLKEQITIFVSTAYLDEAERCTRIALIHKGNILMVDEPVRIRGSIDMPMIEITSSETRSVKEIVASISGVTSVNMYGDRLHVALKAKEIGPKVLETLRARGMVIEGEREITPSLEDVFIARLKKEQ
ncbi:MAG: ybhF-N2 [Deltaproteobacteria bacterium]|nr:ybhF-N2 [Deltaproteobacteria bacterium]